MTMIESGSDRLVTYALFAFNQERYVAEAVRSALAQDYQPLDIIISDDASSDDTYRIIEDEVGRYRGPHRVRLNRNEVNLGLARHLNFVMGMAESNFVVLAAGDDISLPERTRILAERYRSCGSSHFYVSSNAEVLGAEGVPTGRNVLRGSSPDDLLRLAAGTDMPLGAASACTKSLFDHFGALPDKLMNEDFVLPFRAHLVGKVAYVDLALVRYRVSAGSLSQDGEQASSSEIFLRRARYLARQQLALSCMLSDLCHFDSLLAGSADALVPGNLKRILTRRLMLISAAEDFYRHRSGGSRFMAFAAVLFRPHLAHLLVIGRLRRP
ncbi:MAG: glycosyltransferase [Sulfuritalea sp.]|nr:glycosyltransferase [Sulfuritalea sp.]